MPGAEPAISRSDNILILVPDRDSPPKKDFTHVFWPEAMALQSALGETRVFVEKIPVPVVEPGTLTVDTRGKQCVFEDAARRCLDALTFKRWTHVIFMCHGWSTGLQLGFRTAKQRGSDSLHVATLVSNLRALRGSLKTITLFACSSGDEPMSGKSSPGTGDRSIADYLRDRVGCTVIAHWTVGHATRNPDLILFEASDVPLVGGVAWPQRGTAAYRNAARLLTNRRPAGAKRAPGDLPPKGHSRPAFASIPLCQTTRDLQALLSSEPAF